MTQRKSQERRPFRHAVLNLEFGAVLDLIAEGCVNDAAREAVRALEPTADRDTINRSLDEIEAYRRLKAEHGDVPVGDTSCRDDIERAGDRRESITATQLLSIAAGERAAGELARALERADAAEPLAAIAREITPHPEVVEAIEHAIDTDGSVKDTASPALRAIRRDIHELRSALRSLSEKLVGDYGGDSLGTVLGDRYVVLVPRTKIKRRTGLVHSASHTGGSLYFEPLNLVERNNDLESRLADERAEVARILDELRGRVATHAADLLANLDVVDRFDAIRARARFCDRFDCHRPAMSGTGRLRLVDARHPVLVRVLEGRGDKQIPLGLHLDPGGRLMVITGPNAGGKTVALKTTGVCVLLFQCGIPVPCSSDSELPVFERVYVDIGDEQSMESSLSTFTSHLRHLDDMIRHADTDTLCLIDEIGDGTDPDEGAALAIATLERLLESGAAVVATTHYGRIKTFALEAEGVINASMAFEDSEGRPLYHLLQGVAGRSRGLETAQRTGFDPAVTERARSFVGKDSFQLDSVLSKLETTLRGLETERATVAARFAELERLIADYRARAAEYDMTRKEAMRRAAREANDLLEETRREAEAVVKSIRETRARRDSIREGRKRLDDAAKKTKKVMEEAAPQAQSLEAVAVGDRVAVNPSGQPSGEVVDVRKGTATVEIGGKRIRLPIGSLYEPSGTDTAGSGVSYEFRAEPLSDTSLDVRGHDREEALAAVTRFIDQAVYTGVREVKIIHGVGTGVLSRAVGDLLREDHRVESTRPGEQAEGGMGVTIVSLAG